jgi:VWFA-related protein
MWRYYRVHEEQIRRTSGLLYSPRASLGTQVFTFERPGEKRSNLLLQPTHRLRTNSDVRPPAGASLIMVVLIAGTGYLRSQTPQPALHQPAAQIQYVDSGALSGPSSIKVNARLVVLDVVVTDTAGKPVDGLNAKDFQVFEDGRLQLVRSVEPPSAHTLPPASDAGGTSFVFDPAQPASFGHSPVDVLVLDQLNTHFADSSFARRSLRDYLSAQPALLPRPTSLLSLYEKGFRPIQGFSRDRDLLLRSLAATPTEYAWKLELTGRSGHGPIDRLDLSLRALEEIAQTYSSIPSRKNLIWVGGGFPTLDPTSIAGKDMQEVKDTLQHVTDVLLDSRITLYAVDPSSSAAGMNEIVDVSQQAFVDAGGDALGGATDPFSASEDFDKLGQVTGGRIVRDVNDVAHQITSSVDLGANFYTISYTPSSTSDDAARYRKIHVVCLRPGLTASTRTGYYPGATMAVTSSAAAAYDLTTALDSPMPLNGLPVTVERDLAVGAPPGAYIIHTAASGLSWRPNADGSEVASVYILSASINAKNKMLGHTLHGMTATAKPGADLRDGSVTADFHFVAPTSPRPATLRFIVRDSTTGHMGSVDLLPTTHRSPK